MRIYESRRLSHSSLELYGTCRLQWASRYVLGLEEAPSADMLLGSCVHEALAFGNSEWLRTGSPPAPQLPRAHFLARWYELVEGLSVPESGIELALDDYWQGESPSALAEEGARLVANYFAGKAQDYPPAAVELEVAKKLDEDLMYIDSFVGVLDLVSNDIIVEYKVRRRPSSMTSMSLAVQPLAYAYLLGRPAVAHIVELIRPTGEVRAFEIGKLQEDLGWFEGRYLLPLAREIDRSLRGLARDIAGREELSAGEWGLALSELGEGIDQVLYRHFPPNPGWQCGSCLYRFGCGYMV